MASLHIDDALYRRFEADAAARGSSVEADVRRILEEHAPPPPADDGGDDEGERRRAALLEMIERMQSRRLPLPEGFTDSTELIRQMREDRETHLLRFMRGEE